MAERTVVIRTDDVDGSESDDVERREFTLLERTFGIDLTKANHVKLMEVLQELEPFIINATEVRKVVARRKKSAATSKLANGHTNTDLRNWANENGFKVGDRGKIEDKVYDAYYAAFPDANPNPEKQEQIPVESEETTE